MVDKSYKISIRRQSELLSVNRSSLYITRHRRDDGELCNIISEIYSNHPIYGYRRITAMLARTGYNVNHKRVLRLMRDMNLLVFILAQIQVKEILQKWFIHIYYPI